MPVAFAMFGLDGQQRLFLRAATALMILSAVVVVFLVRWLTEVDRVTRENERQSADLIIRTAKQQRRARQSR